MFPSIRFSSVLFGVLLTILFALTMSGEVLAKDRQPNRPTPRVTYYNPLAFDYQAAMRQVNNLPAAYYVPRYYPPYPYPYPYPYPIPRPLPSPTPGSTR